MEWCEVFYDVWRVDRYIRRICEIIIVFLAFIAATYICGSERERTAVLDTQKIVSGSEETAGLLSAGMYDFGFAENPELSEYFQTVPDIWKPENTVAFPETAADRNGTVKTETTAEKPEIQPEEITAGNPVTQPEEMVSEKPAEKPEAMISEQPVSKPGNMAPAVPDETPDNVITDQSQEVPDGGISSDGTADESGGFLINEEGVIYGISDGTEVVVDECLEIPASGCCGISAGAFLEAPSGIREIYIPSNITYIEEGAFLGLAEMEWFEMEASGQYYTEDGVLFSENGNCILGFPAARQGTYRVPAQVTRFARDAFSGAKVEAVDAVKAVVADIGNFPESITLIRDEKQADS